MEWQQIKHFLTLVFIIRTPQITHKVKKKYCTKL